MIPPNPAAVKPLDVGVIGKRTTTSRSANLADLNLRVLRKYSAREA
jgi:hypothetical protein